MSHLPLSKPELRYASTTGQAFAEALIATFQTHHARTAVYDGASTYTYEALLGRALQLTARLRRLDLPAGSVVALSMDRGYDYIASILGVIFAGHSFLPIDPTYPSARIAFMVEDADARCVMLDAARQTWEPPAGIAVVDVRAADTADPALTPASVVNAQVVIYTIYTSGTTGRPKGVPIESAGLATFLWSQGEHLQVSCESRFASISSISFDMSIWEIFLALWHGASIAMLSREITIDGRLLAQTLTRYEVTHVLMTPSMLSLLPAAECKHLQHVLSAGEKCSASLVETWSRLCAFYDAYGATEATIYTTITRKTPQTPTSDVGKPMHGSRIAILGDDGVERAPGQIGEICILGVGVSRGYHRRPELNAEKFLAHAGTRLYRTGDIGYLDEAGSLHFKGRKDKQVKWRGYRIELEEIEAVTNGTRLVTACHATLHQASETMTSLILFVAPNKAAHYSLSDLRGQLKQHLPSHMLPSRLVEVDQIPTTTNGKVNTELLLSTLTQGHHA